MNSEIFNEYLKLCFLLDKLLGKGNLIDAYYGNADVAYTSNVTIDNIKQQLFDLKKQIIISVSNDYPHFTQTFLLKHIDSLIMQIDIQSKKLDYKEIVDTLLDIDFIIPNLETIELKEKELNELLGVKYSSDNLQDKLDKWNIDNQINCEMFMEKFKETLPNFKERTLQLFKKIFPKIDYDYLDKNTEIFLELESTDKGWSAYNYYLNNYKSKIAFNSKNIFNGINVEFFVAHEAFPGHHASSMLKEYFANNNMIGNYAYINLLCSPSSTIEEGIGDFGYNFINNSVGNLDKNIEQCIKELGSEVDIYLAYNMFYNNFNDLTALDFIKKHQFTNNVQKAKLNLDFIKNWSLYVPTYKYGKKIVKEYYTNYGERVLSHLYCCSCKSTLEMWKEHEEIIKRS